MLKISLDVQFFLHNKKIGHIFHKGEKAHFQNLRVPAARKVKNPCTRYISWANNLNVVLFSLFSFKLLFVCD